MVAGIYKNQLEHRYENCNGASVTHENHMLNMPKNKNDFRRQDLMVIAVAYYY